MSVSAWLDTLHERLGAVRTAVAAVQSMPPAPRPDPSDSSGVEELLALRRRAGLGEPAAREDILRQAAAALLPPIDRRLHAKLATILQDVDEALTALAGAGCRSLIDPFAFTELMEIREPDGRVFLFGPIAALPAEHWAREALDPEEYFRWRGGRGLVLGQALRQTVRGLWQPAAFYSTDEVLGLTRVWRAQQLQEAEAEQEILRERAALNQRWAEEHVSPAEQVLRLQARVRQLEQERGTPA